MLLTVPSEITRDVGLVALAENPRVTEPTRRAPAHRRVTDGWVSLIPAIHSDAERSTRFWGRNGGGLPTSSWR